MNLIESYPAILLGNFFCFDFFCIGYVDLNVDLQPEYNRLFGVTQGARKKEDEFLFNKDAGMYVCKAGRMAIRKARQGKKGVGVNRVDTYFFDVEKCKHCLLKEGCYKEGAKSKTYATGTMSPHPRVCLACNFKEQWLYSLST